MEVWRADELSYRARLASYAYLKLDKSESYPPPRAGWAGDLVCSCNTVIYKWEIGAFYIAWFTHRAA